MISQRRAFSVLPVRLLRRSSGIFSVATIIWQLTDILVIRKQHQAVGLAAGRHSPCRSGRLFRPLFQGGQLYERIRWGQRFVNPCAGIPESGQ
ncbi:hypothetical protein SES60163_13168 [Salmonella enterica subsp. salamae serovar 58:l,z13,z28:z6 str. 00-0163]|nr:hypothetical protein SES60163_13168 [Salmonella enterica subsp. salamae serovar 58:l,z13,z28:z6 str. 00-0163]